MKARTIVTTGHDIKCPCGFAVNGPSAYDLFKQHTCPPSFTWPMAAVCIVMGLVIGYIAELIVGLLGS